MIVLLLVKTNHLWVFSIQILKTHRKKKQKELKKQYMDDAKSNPNTLIAGFLPPWKANKNLESEQKLYQERAAKQQ
jgi:hypothetical protein